jgi:uncharacterized protein (TIGR02001 family)
MRSDFLAKGLLRRSSALSTALAALLIAGATDAQDFSGEIGVASENIGKGLGKSGGETSMSGAAAIGHGDFYAELSASTVDIAQGADTEVVATVGYAPTVGAYSFDFSAVHKRLEGAPAGYDNAYMEYQADASRSIGPVGLRMRVNYSPDGSGGTREAWWLEMQGGVAVDDRTRATAAVGERITDGGTDYVAWNAGVKRKLTDKIALDVRWYDTDGHAFGERYEGRLVGALSLSF